MPWRVAAAVVLIALAAANVADLPAVVRVLVVLAAFGVGLAYERMHTAFAFVDRRTALAAGALVIAAIAILLVPTDDPDHEDTDESTPADAIDLGPLPDVERTTARLGETFQAGGASFRVADASTEVWARDIQRTPADSGRRWVALEVSATNRRADHFDPTTLSYRLADSEQRQYFAQRSSGSGPASLGATGSLRPGQTAEVQLGFQVPRSARGLALVFEPAQPASVQVRVALAER